MHTRTAIATVALLVAALAGCSSGAETDAKPVAKKSPSLSPEQQFLGAVHDRNFESWREKGPMDVEIRQYPPKWCAEFEKGHSVDHTLGLDGAHLYPIGMEWGTLEADAHEVVVLGVKYYCPELLDQVTNDLRQSGDY
ncbi:hypothetical protein [Streptomyces sp. NPDC002889]|uniref:hypothetical protein n=1 Tax=Streptomyces sp. NPDC002889 TaxID=3364669 RepID=UPI00367D7497